MIRTDIPLTHLLFTTIRIEAHRSDGETSAGTAFFFLFDLDDQNSVLVLITNKHVINNAYAVTFFLHEATEQNEPMENSIGITVHIAPDLWSYHPGDLDLCVIPCQAIREEVETKYHKKVYMQALGEEHIATDDLLDRLMPIEEITMIGYPILWDEKNNFPLTRRGITALHPALDFRGMPIGVVDIAAFPGSSGSPILIIDRVPPSSPDQSADEIKCTFLGILFAGPQFAANGSINIVNVPTAQTTMVNTMIPAHLGFYIKAKELMALKKALLDKYFTAYK